jgi:hypothetical protein
MCQRVMLKWFFRTYNGRILAGLISLRIGQVVVLVRVVNTVEPLGSEQCGKIFNKLRKS